MEVYSLTDLLGFCQSPSCAQDQTDPALMLDLRSAKIPAGERGRINHWLSRRPIPVLALIDDHCSLLEGLDIALTDESKITAVYERICAYPQASAVLTQTTRMTSLLPMSSALIAESLAYATLQGGEAFSDWLNAHSRPSKPDPADAPVSLKRNGAALHITLCSPSTRNALSVAMRDGLSEAFALVAMDTTIQSAIVSAEGPCFSAGGDLTEFGTCADVSQAHQIRQLQMPAGFIVDHTERYTFKLHGACIGAGIELPAFAKHVIAHPKTHFRLPEVEMGLIPGAGGCVSIPRRIGRHRTNLLALTGETLTAAQALDWGLIDAVDDSIESLE